MRVGNSTPGSSDASPTGSVTQRADHDELRGRQEVVDYCATGDVDALVSGESVGAAHDVQAEGLDLEHTEIAKCVKKVGGDPPMPEAIRLLRKQFDDDPDWHPGKGMETGKRPGPKPRFTPQKKRCVAECAMAMARRGEEVTVEAVQARSAR